MKQKFVRLDKYLTEKGFAASRTTAQQYIEEGRVSVNGITVNKASAQISPEASVRVDAPEKEWVSRGAYKLLKAMQVFAIDARDKCCIDIGASTGGFTDVLLSYGAARIFAVDVGYGQLAWKLRNDKRVAVLERTNARNLTLDMVENVPADIIVSDASFISVTLLLPVMESLIKDDGKIIILAKPQFEAGRERVGHGVITDAKLHETILSEVISFIKEHTGLAIRGIDFSPIKGPEGNIEFLFLLEKKRDDADAHFDIAEIVAAAHKNVTAHPL